MKPRPASQRAMAAKPTQKQLRAAFASQAPITHGKPKTGTYNGFLTLLIIPFGIWVLHKGGFW